MRVDGRLGASTQWMAHRIAGSAALASDFAWMFLSPFYEEGISVFVTPIVCCLGVFFLYRYLKKSPWAYRYSPHYALANGLLMALFVGKSTEFYGQYAVPMSIVEIGVLGSSAALLGVYFLPVVSAHFRAGQTNNAFFYSTDE